MLSHLRCPGHPPPVELRWGGSVESPALTEGDREGPAPSWTLPALRRRLASPPLFALHSARGPFQGLLQAADCLAFGLGGRPGCWFSAALQGTSEAGHRVAVVLARDGRGCGLALRQGVDEALADLCPGLLPCMRRP